MLGVSIIASQIIKQSSIERQANAKLEQERQVLEYQKEQDRQAKATEALNELQLDNCLEIAEDEYWNYAELNGTGDRENGVKMSQHLWDNANKNKKADEDNCYKRYK